MKAEAMEDRRYNNTLRPISPAVLSWIGGHCALLGEEDGCAHYGVGGGGGDNLLEANPYPM